MNRYAYILILCLLLCGTAASGQTYDRVHRDNLWNASENITGVRQDTVSRSCVLLSGRYEDGGFKDTWQAARGWSAGVSTASIRHLERMSLKGSFAFVQTEGYDMCGSMFIKPGFYPVDVLEFTPGRKTLQTYSFDGGISYDLADSWRIGARVDFESSNLAKRKDLRHSNMRLDFDLAPGFMYHSGELALGANYFFRKTSETVEADQLGISESSYYAFLDKGLMYGVYSIWTGSGLHLDESGVKGFPVKEFSNGAAVQMQYRGLFAQIEYINTSGTIGEKEYIWFRFPGNSVNVYLGYRHDTGKIRHYARLNFGMNERKLDETVHEKVTVGGVSTVVTHGKNRISSENVWTVKPEYELVAEGFEVLASAHMSVQRKSSFQMYPYIYMQSLADYGADVQVKTRLGRFDLSAGIACAAGTVYEEDLLADDASGVQTEPYRLRDWYDRQIEYRTAPRLGAGLSLRWNFFKGLYMEASGKWMHGFGLRYMTSADRFAASFGLGYDF